ncbi:MAG: DUF2934 domain-containing protein [Deltaproteobacteria bacterium]|nr:DUF2934 domain-containing protein [Deltaproteobacteria bacterium]
MVTITHWVRRHSPHNDDQNHWASAV